MSFRKHGMSILEDQKELHALITTQVHENSSQTDTSIKLYKRTTCYLKRFCLPKLTEYMT